MNVINPYRLSGWSPDLLGDRLAGWFDASQEDTLFSLNNLTGNVISRVSSWQDVRGKFQDGGYGYLRSPNNQSSPYTNRGLFEADGSKAQNHINGLNAVTFPYIDEAGGEVLPRLNTRLDESITGNANYWQPFGVSDDPFDKIGFWFSMRTHSPVNNTDRGTMIIQVPAGAASGKRILLHAPWTAGTFIQDFGNQGTPTTDNRIANSRYAGDPYPIVKDVVVGSYAENDLVNDPNIAGSSFSYLSVGGLATTKDLEVDGILGDYFGIGGGGNYQEHTLGEILFTKGEITQDERYAIEGYLAHKWNGDGTSFTDEFPLNHPWKTIAP